MLRGTVDDRRIISVLEVRFSGIRLHYPHRSSHEFARV